MCIRDRAEAYILNLEKMEEVKKEEQENNKNKKQNKVCKSTLITVNMGE